MTDCRAYMKWMLPELEEMRGVVSSSAGAVNEPVARLAWGYQVKALQDMYVVVTQCWFDVQMQKRGHAYEEPDDEVELAFAERLSTWLRAEAAYVERVAHGGEIDPRRVKTKWGEIGLETYLAGHRLFAIRHHEMIGAYCDRVATALEHRAAELRHVLSYSNVA